MSWPSRGVVQPARGYGRGLWFEGQLRHQPIGSDAEIPRLRRRRRCGPGAGNPGARADFDAIERAHPGDLCRRGCATTRRDPVIADGFDGSQPATRQLLAAHSPSAAGPAVVLPGSTRDMDGARDGASELAVAAPVGTCARFSFVADGVCEKRASDVPDWPGGRRARARVICDQRVMRPAEKPTGLVRGRRGSSLEHCERAAIARHRIRRRWSATVPGAARIAQRRRTDRRPLIRPIERSHARRRRAQASRNIDHRPIRSGRRDRGRHAAATRARADARQ